MFHFFSPKSFLLDSMQGMPDIHCHVLPGIDDGAADRNASRIILQKYKDLGFRKIIATPHTMGEVYPNTPQSIQAAHQSIIKDSLGIDLLYASEYMLDDQFEVLLEKGELLPLKDRFILIEMSYFQPPFHLRELLFKITSNGYTPVLAHPERYAFYHNDLSIFEEFKSNGCLLQLNALSLSQHYGIKVQKTAFRLLDLGYYDFIGTDVHRLGHLEAIAALKVDKKKAALINVLCRNNILTFS